MVEGENIYIYPLVKIEKVNRYTHSITGLDTKTNRAVGEKSKDVGTTYPWGKKQVQMLVE